MVPAMSASDTDDRKWWHPGQLQGRRTNLRVRSEIKGAIARSMRERGFDEVETSALQVSPGLEPHLVAFETKLQAPGGHGDSATRYLHTSPEFAMKKLLAGGMERIWQLARVYRNAEGSRTHHPEFTMLEWYRAGGRYLDLIDDCQALFAGVAEATGVSAFRYRDVLCSIGAAPDVMTVAEAFDRFCDVDLRETYVDAPSDPEPARLMEAARALGIRVADDDRWDDVFFRVFSERIEPRLGVGAPTYLIDYPISMAALARAKPNDPMIAERVEVYVCGLELANGFGELTDAAVQRARFEADMTLKERLYGHRYPIDEDFLEAVDVMPDAAGMALGFDRLVMLTTGAEDIRAVLWSWVD